MSKPPPQILRDLVEAAIQWRKTKYTYTALTDSKKSRKVDVLAARRLHMRAVAKLERAVLDFEKLFTTKPVAAADKKPVNWKNMIDGLAMAAAALSKATDGASTTPAPQVIDARVIDMPTD